MNFVRSKCDERAMQSLMQEDAFSLRVRNETFAAAIRTNHVDLNSTVAPDAIPPSFARAYFRNQLARSRAFECEHHKLVQTRLGKRES